MSTPDDVHRLARAMPHVTALTGPKGNTIYQVGGKSFVFFRTPQPDARFDDVIMFWVPSEEDKLALLATEPFFTTPRFDGHPSVLLRGSRLGEVGLDELTEIVQDAWLARASTRRRERWLAEQDGA
ncbi:MmcQ/YjbR family DNA-binding protein [Actinomycetospora termitidis]|uniref:MmcQ/YjbR family DNA-binding protein n=1 Tax=Actinomycetospora termitidis TaxID=3053470 RepID=A0ABT7M6W6_9PSEU|nr:MmcQ/YjbR family DNA-binding protein [Actinomycetospora sp. Odt1-22]MDL5155969.1 MmcQ/YjbR family DNA-binding protein [Actinomycetospora sp. Odt1-22]